MDAYDIAASALTAQRLRMDAISSNLANVNTTRKVDGSIGAYHRKNVIFSPLLNKAQSSLNFGLPFSSSGDEKSIGGLGSSTDNDFGDSTLGRSILTGHVLFEEQPHAAVGVSVTQITEDKNTPMRMVYDPSHPDANSDGYVEMPNVNVITEMVDMISASRAYEANVTALQSTKGMAQAAIQI